MKKLQFSQQKASGFILVATIWMLAATTVVAAAFSIWVQRSLELVSQQAEKTQSSMDMISTKSTLLYLLSTQVKNQAGLVLFEDSSSKKDLPGSFFDPMSLTLPAITGDELNFDNRAYSGVKSAIFSLQDEAGLININSPNSTILHDFLLQQGLTSKQKDALIDKLIDYIDEDDANRVQGAESFHYRQAGLAAPPNKRLKSPFELYNVMGWKKFILRDPEIFNHLTTANVFLVNVNTANNTILSLIPGLNTQKAEHLIQSRDRHAFESLYVADKATGLSLDIHYESLTTFLSAHTRLYLWHKNSPLIEQFSVQLTPSSKTGKPWKINSSFALPKTLIYENQQPIRSQTILFNSSIQAAKN